MTSELLMMNKSAIVLAADSTVTVDDKTYTGIKKIFEPLEDIPFAVMIYNNAEFMDVPFETLIGDFYNNVNEDEKTDIVKFRDGLIDYLSRKTHSVTVENIKEIIVEMKDEIDEWVNREGLENVYEVLDSSLKDEDILPFLNDSEFLQYFSEIFGKDYDIPLNLFKKYVSYELKGEGTNVIIAGFNKSDLFPSFMTFNLVFNYEGEIIYQIEYCKINHDKSTIIPFAQSEMINSFLEGVDSTFEENILNFVNFYFDNYLNDIFDKLESKGNLRQDELNKFVVEINNIKSQIVEYKSNEFILDMEDIKNSMKDPIINSISYLSIKDLCYMAESLINITSLKIKVLGELETVGGEVDVCYLTKNNGFSWFGGSFISDEL